MTNTLFRGIMDTKFTSTLIWPFRPQPLEDTMRKAVQTYTKQEFDTPIALVIVAIVFSIISIVMCFNIEAVTMFPNERYGIYLATIGCVGMTAYVTHVYTWGRKVTYGH